MAAILGEVEEIIFRNEVNGYTVFAIRQEENMITVIGHLISINVGETIKATGKWVSHPSYGQQFKADLCEKELPKTENSIIKFLGSGIIKGMREPTARKIVGAFGERTLDIIRDETHKLAEIKGIKLERAFAIGQAFRDYGQVWEVSLFLQQYGISPQFVNKIYKQFGYNSKEIVKENPYRLADEIQGIGFKTADRIALASGIDPFSQNRIASCVKYILSKAAIEQGHTFLPINTLEEYSAYFLGVEASRICDVIASMAINGDIKLKQGVEGETVYLKSLDIMENKVCRKLLDLAMVNFQNIDKSLLNYISTIEKQQDMVLAEEQRMAVVQALENGITVITGGPGTGKTTIINTIVQLLEKAGLSYLLAAPTGRAAKRLSEATGREAKTIHRMLELGRREDQDIAVMTINTNALILNEDVIIIDETSMVDIVLMNHFVASVVSGTRIIMVGDADQLPAVGPGNVLKDIISSGVIKVVKLTEIFRQAKESMIILNAHKINRGEYPDFNTTNGDFFIQKDTSITGILKNVISLYSERLPTHKGYDPFKDIQVLSPTRKGIVGIKNLNNEIQKVLNPETSTKKQKTLGEVVFREGDKVMQIKNNYDITWRKADTGEYGVGVFNGDIGKITEVDEKDGVITVHYDDKEVEYSADTLEELELAYAITVHKSQGSEFSVVLMPIIEGLPMLTTRNLLYTAITRAREMVVLVGREESVRKMVDNSREFKRHSGLAEKLKKQVLGC